MRVRQHLLSIFFGVIFLIALALQSVAGLLVTNQENATHGEPALTWVQFVTSSDFVVDVAENWQSEYLQFFLFILATIWLVQKGSPESKQPGEEGVGSDREQLVGRYARADSPAWARAGGWRTWVYSNSLLLTMGTIFLLSWLAQALAGQVVYNQEQSMHGQAPIDLAQYLANPDFWNRTLQNWQSEFLAVGSMVALSIILRQRGSSESKPVGTPHEATSVEG
ncbi:DUF6766 family protein [Agromyces aurantiacus]|uniref:DUF6766 family protein n=1 Tax=Agromyces aurantiacus TaxID=165814 RepID=A0ABV9R5H5_9MICO|nr:DUF6766 family protein [Agromyces aurantiacus]MBM7503211.1 hypothetical protein [Agromyces aurantiacus]